MSVTRTKLNGIDYFKLNLTDRELALVNLADKINTFLTPPSPHKSGFLNFLLSEEKQLRISRRLEEIDECESEAETEVDSVDKLMKGRYDSTGINMKH